ncbi:MAG: heavy-metal-associated domain-containing protein [Flavobacteriales bacterium]|nr:heavy-metal-associated domain-containing protein [Flavobacteriales bacterium]MCB9365346.1 heavy-metal-associated domain-containing protein [Flavobacteriales bacterium]
MKNLIAILVVAIFSVTGTTVKAQSSRETKKIEIKTSAQCEMCKERLEKAFAYEKGVKSSELDVKTAVFTVEYLPSKTTPEKLQVAVTKVGYDADSLKADEKAYNKLPNCCQKGGMH